jgi:ribosomal protein S27E
MEKSLGIVLPKKNVLTSLSETCQDPDAVILKGRITEFAVYGLKNSLFQYTDDDVKAGMSPNDIFYITTVQHWVNLCINTFNYLPSACPECQNQTATIAPSGKAMCESCNTVLKPQSGDDIMAETMRIATQSWLAKNN